MKSGGASLFGFSGETCGTFAVGSARDGSTQVSLLAEVASLHRPGGGDVGDGLQWEVWEVREVVGGVAAVLSTEYSVLSAGRAESGA